MASATVFLAVGTNVRASLRNNDSLNNRPAARTGFSCPSENIQDILMLPLSAINPVEVGFSFAQCGPLHFQAAA